MQVKELAFWNGSAKGQQSRPHKGSQDNRLSGRLRLLICQGQNSWSPVVFREVRNQICSSIFGGGVLYVVDAFVNVHSGA